MRKWSIEVCVLGPDGEELPADVFDKVTYKLHPTFANPTRVVKTPPFLVEEEGWGEFDIDITLHVAERGGEHHVIHLLNFSEPVYSVDHKLTFPANKPVLNELLAKSGPVPQLSAGPTAATSGADSVTAPEKRSSDSDDKSRPKKLKTAVKGSVDLEKLAQGLEKLSEEDVLGIVQMVVDNKTADMYVKNDADAGEFHMDLYTLPDRLLKSMWDFVKSRTEVA